MKVIRREVTVYKYPVKISEELLYTLDCYRLSEKKQNAPTKSFILIQPNVKLQGLPLVKVSSYCASIQLPYWPFFRALFIAERRA